MSIFITIFITIFIIYMGSIIICAFLDTAMEAKNISIENGFIPIQNTYLIFDWIINESRLSKINFPTCQRLSKEARQEIKELKKAIEYDIKQLKEDPITRKKQNEVNLSDAGRGKLFQYFSSSAAEYKKLALLIKNEISDKLEKSSLKVEAE